MLERLEGQTQVTALTWKAGQNLGVGFSPSTMWAPGTEFRWAVLVQSVHVTVEPSHQPSDFIFITHSLFLKKKTIYLFIY